MLLLQAIRFEGLNPFIALISALGNGAVIWILLGVVLAIFAESRKTGVAMLVSVLVTWILCFIIGNVVGRPHPCEEVQGLVAVVGVSHSGYSFPSFHAATAGAALAVIIRARDGRLAMPVFIFAVLEVFSRLYLGVDYPSDCLVGVILGIAVGFIVSFLLSNLSFDMEQNVKRKSVGKGRATRSKTRRS